MQTEKCRLETAGYHSYIQAVCHSGFGRPHQSESAGLPLPPAAAALKPRGLLLALHTVLRAVSAAGCGPDNAVCVGGALATSR